MEVCSIGLFYILRVEYQLENSREAHSYFAVRVFPSHWAIKKYGLCTASKALQRRDGYRKRPITGTRPAAADGVFVHPYCSTPARGCAFIPVVRIP